MAVRTTDEAVAGIIEVDETISLTPFIEVASSLVDDHCTDSDYTDAKLELIERWLAAHYYALGKDPRAASEKAGSVGQSYQVGKLGFNLLFTQWGQMACMLDSAGNLAKLSKSTEEGIPKRSRLLWLGTDPSETTETEE